VSTSTAPMRLNRRILLAFATVLTLMAGASLFGIVRLNQALSVYAGPVQAASNDAAEIATLLSSFRLQTQEWKNTLLRGKDAAAREKHWTAFQMTHREILERARALGVRLPAGEARNSVEAFTAAHVEMGRSYGKGYEAFERAGFDPSVGDRAVKGIDRAPAKVLDEAVFKIAQDAKLVAEKAAHSGEQASLASVALMLVVALMSLAAATAFSRVLIRQLGADPYELIVFVRKVAGGDLASPPALAASNTSSVMAMLVQMQEALAAAVAKVRENTEQVATASEQIAMGNRDLSSRTERQSSALQQTAATMDELGETVRSNADTAAHVNSLAQDASTVAMKGGVAVASVVGTMHQISASSSRIGEIIGTIDGIAFQTNI